MGARAGGRGSAWRSTSAAAQRSSRTSASASSGCCASSRSWRSNAGAGTPRRRSCVGADEIERAQRHSAERHAFALADALVGGDARAATLRLPGLRAPGRAPRGLGYLMASRLREALAVALRLQAGESRGEIKRAPADALARRRALRRRRRPRDPSGCAPRSARSPTSSSTRAAASCAPGAEARGLPRRSHAGDRDAVRQRARSRQIARLAIAADAGRLACGSAAASCRRRRARRGTSCGRRCCGAARRA